MKKHHWRQQIKTLFESHADPEKHEQMKENRNDMEVKKEKIIKLIKGEETDGSNGKPESLEELVKDYHKQYESLYELYHNLTGELKKKVHDKYEEGKGKFSTSSSDSDSEGDHSSKGNGSKNGETQTDGLRQELEAANHEIDNLRAKLTTTNEEKEALSSECATTLSKLQDADKAVDDLKAESARWDDERLQLISENNHKKESEEELKAQISQLEETLKEREDQYSDVLKKLSDIERESESKTEALTAKLNSLEKEAETMRAKNTELEEQLISKNGEASAQMKELFDHLNSFQKELSTLATLKAELESELERKSQEVSENQTKIETLENENAELRSKVVDLELNLRSAERKTEELSRGNESNDQLVIQLQTTIEDLQRDIEMDKDEMLTIEEKNRNLEVMLRLSNQKLRVTEQLLVEKEASHQQLEEKHVALGQTLESYSDMIKDISGQVNVSLGALECVVMKKFDEDYGGLAKKVMSLSEEVQGVKSWVTATRLEKEAMAVELGKVKGEEMAMRERIESLEAKLSQLDKAMREKDESLVGLGEEKREAIRHLCVWIEYYRSRCVELRGVLLKMVPKARRANP